MATQLANVGVAGYDAAKAEEEKKLRDDDANKAQQHFDELSDEQSGLPAKIREARERRDEAQTEMERLNGRLSVAAQTESAAFARARDNAPFWYAAPVASNPDPLKRVELTSSTGGDNTITIRGLERRFRLRRVQYAPPEKVEADKHQ